MNELGKYNGISIYYNAEPDSDQYVNATQMCKATGKKWNDYWRLEQTQAFLSALSAETGIPVSRLVVVRKGGRPEEQGTWVHRRVAYHLGQWCSPEFAVWVSGKIDQLVTGGRVVLHREHQEAELVVVGADVIYQMLQTQQKTLDIATMQGEQIIRQGTQIESAIKLTYELLKKLSEKTPSQVEKVVVEQLRQVEGGVREYRLGRGMRVDLIVKGKWLIECKHFSAYKGAVGQSMIYSMYADIEEEKRIHFFVKPNEKMPSESRRLQVERECRHLGITVTWHDWEKYMPKPRDAQRMLPMSWDDELIEHAQPGIAQ